MKQLGLRAGDHVLVRTPGEILVTLDADGTLDGLPFMPEMLDWCGKPFRVQRRVEKTCFYASGHLQPMRRFPDNDVVILDGPRCDGAGHDGCKRACRVFWKEAWLRSTESSTAAAPSSTDGLAELRARLRVKSDATHYLCQSTQLGRATETFPGRQKPWILRIAFRQIRNGDLPLPAVVKLFALWSYQKLRRAVAGDDWLRGPHTRTPSTTLNLKPGELVRIKSRDEIVATLDNKRRNRGMGMCYEVTRCCEHEAKVRYRVDRIIDEQSGEMRDMRDTVALGPMRGAGTLGEECLCYDELGDCPRGELMYWREIWLERVHQGQKPDRVAGTSADKTERVPVGR
jgi:hypothetical protein